MAWKIPGADQFSIWNADGNGNSTSYALMDGNSLALKSLEPAFHQDLNGDGFIGIANAAIETAGWTGFSAVNNHFVLGSGGSAISLKKSGADFDAAQTMGFVPVGAEQPLDDCDTINALIAANTVFSPRAACTRNSCWSGLLA
jgi:serralysin